MSWPWLAVLATIASGATRVHAQPSGKEVAQELSNPIAPLIGVALQDDLEWRGGPTDDGFRSTLTLQPVIPFAIAHDWNLVSRSSLPLVYQTDLVAGDARRAGLDNTTESLFVSPKRTRIPGLTWGVGPVVALPATDAQLGAQRIGLGPTVAVIDTIGPVTYGVLVEEVWSIGGGSEAYLQPQVAWTVDQGGTTLGARSEMTHEWNTRPWTVPVIVDVARPVDLADHALEVSIGAIAYLARPEDAPRWGLRVSVTLVIRTKS